MKKIIILVCVTVLSTFIMAFAEGKNDKGGELRPLQKVMRTRAALLKAMNENLPQGKYAEIVRDADALSAQTKKISESIDGERKEITLKVSALAQEASDAAKKKEGKMVRHKLDEIKTTCGSCHAKYRDKKVK